MTADPPRFATADGRAWPYTAPAYLGWPSLEEQPGGQAKTQRYALEHMVEDPLLRFSGVN